MAATSIAVSSRIQVAGYTVGYKGLRYMTILGAGHFTPEMKPLESLMMFERFLSDQNL